MAFHCRALAVQDVLKVLTSGAAVESVNASMLSSVPDVNVEVP